MTGLKPCPFCGESKVIFDCDVHHGVEGMNFGYKIICKTRFATFYNAEWNKYPCEAKQAIIDKWNTRSYESEEDE